MNEEIKEFLNDKVYVLVYRDNYDRASAVNQQLIDYVKQLQQENKQLKAINEEYERLNEEKGRGFKITNVQKYNIDELLSYKKYKDNWNKLREYFNERIEVCDNRLSSPFCNFEKTTKERLIFSQCLEKLEELVGSDSND